MGRIFLAALAMLVIGPAVAQGWPDPFPASSAAACSAYGGTYAETPGGPWGAVDHELEHTCTVRTPEADRDESEPARLNRRAGRSGHGWYVVVTTTLHMYVIYVGRSVDGGAVEPVVAIETELGRSDPFVSRCFRTTGGRHGARHPYDPSHPNCRLRP